MINLKILRRVWERIHITTEQSGVMDAGDALELIGIAEWHAYFMERLKNGMIHSDIYGNNTITTAALNQLIKETDEKML